MASSECSPHKCLPPTDHKSTCNIQTISFVPTNGVRKASSPTRHITTQPPTTLPSSISHLPNPYPQPSHQDAHPTNTTTQAQTTTTPRPTTEPPTATTTATPRSRPATTNSTNTLGTQHRTHPAKPTTDPQPTLHRPLPVTQPHPDLRLERQRHRGPSASSPRPVQTTQAPPPTADNLIPHPARRGVEQREHGAKDAGQ